MLPNRTNYIQHHRKWSAIRPPRLWILPRWHLPLVDKYIVVDRVYDGTLFNVYYRVKGVLLLLPNCRVKSLTFNLVVIITHRCAPCLTSAGGLHHRQLNSSHRDSCESLIIKIHGPEESFWPGAAACRRLPPSEYITDWIAPGGETLPTSRRTDGARALQLYPHTIDDRV